MNEETLREEWEKFLTESLDKFTPEFCIENVCDFWLSKIHTLQAQHAKERREEMEKLVGEVRKLETMESKVSVFGKGMDSWEARNYDEKMLVNAVLKSVLALLKSRIGPKPLTKVPFGYDPKLHGK